MTVGQLTSSKNGGTTEIKVSDVVGNGEACVSKVVCVVEIVLDGTPFV